MTVLLLQNVTVSALRLTGSWVCSKCYTELIPESTPQITSASNKVLWGIGTLCEDVLLSLV